MTHPREVFMIIGPGGEVLWSDASSNPAALPDSRQRWEAIWNARAQLQWLVHSHPLGPRDFSQEDLTTMAALDAAVGRPLKYAVLAPDGLVTSEGGAVARSQVKPWWVDLLRLASGMG